MNRLAVTVFAAAAASLGGCASPITVVERAIEARSSSDIVEDNRIVLEINRIMADQRTIKASTEIYEQRLLVTGIFDDAALYDRFKRQVEGVRGVKRLYWHVATMSEAEQNRRSAELLGWADALALDTKVGANLIGTRGVADVNYRVAVDFFAAVYLIGRARSGEEKAKAIATAREVSGVKRVVDYVEVRP